MGRTQARSRQLFNSHPGEIQVEEFLKPMKYRRTAPAQTIAVPPRRIDEILLCNRAITADTDLRPAPNFNLSVGFFSALKTDYELKERKRDLKGGSAKKTPSIQPLPLLDTEFTSSNRKNRSVFLLHL